MGRARLVGIAALMIIAFVPTHAFASFHLWQIKEVYSSSDGNIQYIELFTTSAGQELVNGHTITASNGSTTSTFTFPANTGNGTASKHLLIATPGFARISGAPAPDFTLPCGPFIPLAGTTITISFPGADTISFALSALPTDGINSLTDTNLGAAASLQSGAASPTNFAGTAGTVTLSSCQAAATCDACDDELFCNGVETCSASACQPGTAPCAQACIEGTDECVECIDNDDCDDSNPCTDDTCNGANECDNPPHVGSCDDGMFCNGADTCVGTVCTHAGDPCAGANCNEGPDTCGNCTGVADCEDGQSCTTDVCNTGTCARTTLADGVECDTDQAFCNGVGTCTTGVCGSVEEPCDPATESCDEDGDACTAVASPDASVDAPMDPVDPPDDDEGCCQANTSLATFTGPALVLLLGFAFSLRRRRQRQELRRTRTGELATLVRCASSSSRQYSRWRRFLVVRRTRPRRPKPPSRSRR